MLIGDSDVGKSQLLSRFTKNEFNLESKATIGVEFATKTVKSENDQILKVQIWDTAGQERYRAVASSYYRGAVGAMIVYDITNHKSFTNAENWMNELKQKGPKGLAVYLIGNKSDLAAEKRQVKTEEADQYASLNNIQRIETSALDSTNVDEAFNSFVKQIYDKMTQAQSRVQSEASGSTMTSKGVRLERMDSLRTDSTTTTGPTQ